MKSLLFSSLLALSGIGWCQVPQQDFSTGFELLAGLGMPPLDAGATWAKVADANTLDYGLRDYTRSLKGNGWLIRDKDGTLRQLELGSLTPEEMPQKGKEPQPQDLGKDVEGVIHALQKAAEKKNPDEIYSEYHYSRIDSLLIFATQLHQTGNKDLANRLAHATFAFFPTRESAVDAVVHRIAEQFHQQTVTAFFESGDWSRYQRELTALTQRYPRGWKNLGAVHYLLPQVARQAKGDTAPEPSLPGVTLDPKAVAILRELMQRPKHDTKEEETKKNMPPEVRRQLLMMRAQGYHDYGYSEGGFHEELWLLSEQKPDADAPLSRLAALGMAAIPALAAVADDVFLTYQRNSSSSGSHYFLSRESEEERNLRAYQSLSRPATRGEIATSMLALTLPDPENELRNADAQSIRELAMDFWKTHKNSTPEQLAAVFLKEGSTSQVSRAVAVLAKSKNPDALKLFEDHVLAADPAISMFESVRWYLKERRDKGKPFFDQYAQLVRKQTSTAGEEEENEHSWMIKQAGGVEKILKQLNSLAEGESPRAMAIRIGKEEDEKSAYSAINGLMEAMSAEEPKKQLLALLSGAYAAAQDENVRAHFLSAIFQIDWDGQQDGQERVDDETKPVARTISEAEGKVWQRLIADTRPLKSSRGMYYGSSSKSTVSSLACMALESSIQSREFHAFMESTRVMVRPVDEVLAERAKARLSGKPVAPVPNAENVTPERLAVIVAEAAEKPAASLHEHLLTLTLDERAAWASWLRKPGDIPQPDNVKQLRHQVVKLSETGLYTPEPVSGFDVIPVGFQVTEKSIQTLVQSLAAQSEKYSRAVILLGAADFGPGLMASASVVPFPEPKSEDGEEGFDPYSHPVTADSVFGELLPHFEDPNPQAVIKVGFNRGRQSEALWTVVDGKATRVETEDKDDAFLQTLQAVLEDENPNALRVQWMILTRADAEKINSQNE